MSDLLTDITENTEVAELESIDNQDTATSEDNKQQLEDTMQALILQHDDFKHLKAIVEALLFASDKPLSLKQIMTIMTEHNEDVNTRVKDKVKFNKKYICLAIDELSLDYENQAIEIKLLGPGYRIQTKAEHAPWVQRLWQEKPSKYSKATLETLAIIAYRQPITRGEIESIRGVAVSSHIIRNLHDRNWIKVVGHKELPGRPAIYATTQDFLADLNLEKLEDLPTLADIKEIKQDLFSKLEEEMGAFDDVEQPKASKNTPADIECLELSHVLDEQINEIDSKHQEHVDRQSFDEVEAISDEVSIDNIDVDKETNN